MNRHWWHIYLAGDALLVVILLLAVAITAAGSLVWIAIAGGAWTCFCVRRG
jgi:hypothetical protein